MAQAPRFLQPAEERPKGDFIDPGPLLDEDLELVRPAPQWAEAMLAACEHPLTRLENDGLQFENRQQIALYLRNCPHGQRSGRPLLGIVPCCHFWMKLRRPVGGLTLAGNVGLRLSHDRETQQYFGHLGYYVFPAARGHHLAERAARLLLPLAEAYGLRPLWITCNPDNHASRRTCQRLGARLVETVPVPPGHVLYRRGDRIKCRFCLSP